MVYGSAKEQTVAIHGPSQSQDGYTNTISPSRGTASLAAVSFEALCCVTKRKYLYRRRNSIKPKL